MHRLILALLLLSVLGVGSAWAVESPSSATRPLTKEQVESMVQDQVDQALRAQRPKWEDRIEALSQEYAGRAAGDVKKGVDDALEQARIENAKLEIKVDEAHRNLDRWFGFLTLLIAAISIALGFTASRAVKDAKAHEKEARAILGEINKCHADARQKVQDIQERVASLDALADKPLSPEQRHEVAELAADDSAPMLLRLKAKAYQAGERKDWGMALDMWRALARLDPENAIFAFNAGVTAHKMAGMNPLENRQYFNEAVEFYRQAQSKAPTAWAAFTNHGAALAELANLAPDAGEKKRLLDEAIGLYRQAQSKAPEDANGFSNHGAALAELAKLAPAVEEKKRLLDEAIGLYQQAQSKAPENADAFYNHGSALLSLSMLEQSGKETILQEAERLLNKAYCLSRDTRMGYNFACLWALRDNEENCRQWLEKAREWIQQNCAQFSADAEFDSMRDKKWFQDFVAEVCPDGEGPGDCKEPKSS
ncbi:TPR end-of-group domain-containing protein [Desulfovibrio aminophilus]|uniref:TPR end-of-group domain-containing protein n=1 Tax=Desulfovibrio aminophilus TaxID=81425 RepID=UPI0004816769|nr:hypothetical protein [Desulfovibrio aminophilus]